MPGELKICLLGELQVLSDGRALVLPASRKARALLGYLAASNRPHRRERLCELFWDLPDDPKAALRWALTKLRQVVDSPDSPRIIADRERVYLDTSNVTVDLREIHGRLRDRKAVIPVEVLEEMAQDLELVPLDGLDGAGDVAFDAWLASEREDTRLARAEVLRRLALHPDLPPLQARKWLRLWRETDPEGVDFHEAQSPRPDSRRAATPPPEAAQRGMRESAPNMPQPVAPKRAAGDGQAAGQAADQADGRRKAPTAPSPRPSTSALISRFLREQHIDFCQAPDGTKIAYASVGAGAPILKAANWLNHLEFDWTSPIWARSFAELARNRTFVRYDERGCGLSDWDVRDLNFDAFVEDLEVVADRLGMERFPLIGISQGAAVSIEYAVRHPERVSGLILVGGYAAGWRHMASPEEQERREAVLTLTKMGWGTDNPAYRHIFSQTFMPDASPEDLSWFDDFQRQTTSPSNAARFQDAFGHIDVRHRLHEVRAPTIVLHSRYDQRIPLDMGRALAEGIPGAHFVALESHNHIIVDSEPAWQVFVDEVASFLTERNL